VADRGNDDVDYRGERESDADADDAGAGDDDPRVVESRSEHSESGRADHSSGHEDAFEVGDHHRVKPACRGDCRRQ
jgi:hypothetical protein